MPEAGLRGIDETALAGMSRGAGRPGTSAVVRENFRDLGVRLRDEFEIVYLPVVHREGPPSLEALLRWRHPKLGLVTPAAFIAQAEESGLILPIGAGVLRGATRFAATLDHAGVRVVVNLSARQFLQPDLVESVEDALRKSGLEASRLELDLTEATAMTEGEESTERLRRLRGLGVQLALDDFGTGYFSIRRIRDLGFRRLKIDRSLVSGLPANEEQAAHVVAIIGLGRSLGLEVVAEGVETEEQRVHLVRWQCDRMQGNLCGPPTTAAEAEGLLLRQRRAARDAGSPEAEAPRRLL
jgi:EAL domain-containing protein (putative c-di-GMP-specific phosphodiesterase class I)